MARKKQRVAALRPRSSLSAVEMVWKSLARCPSPGRRRETAMDEPPKDLFENPTRAMLAHGAYKP